MLTPRRRPPRNYSTPILWRRLSGNYCRRDRQLRQIKNDLIQDEEVRREMRYNLWGPPNYDWIFEELAQRSEEERQRFFQIALQKISEAISPEEAVQKLLHIKVNRCRQ
jgi:hypothetical protein